MKFYVIEGDNGTGKDTLAAKFQNDGFEILTYEKNKANGANSKKESWRR